MNTQTTNPQTEHDKSGMWFTAFGLALIIIACDLLTFIHYVTHLNGPALIGTLVVFLGIMIVIFCAFWMHKAKNNVLKWVAIIWKLGLMAIALLCAIAIIALHFDDGYKKKAEQDKLAMAEQEANLEIQKANALKDATIEVKKATKSNKATAAFVEKTGQTKTATATVSVAKPADEANDSERVYKWLLEFATRHIYYVPALAHFLAFATLIIILAWTGNRPLLKAAAATPAPSNQQEQIEAEVQRIVAQTLANAQQPTVQPGGTRRPGGLAPQPAASSEKPEGKA
jgi:hypothetical protein